MKNKIGIIVGREFNERVRKKSFIATTLLTPLLMIALMLAPMLLTTYSESSVKKIAVVDDSNVVADNLQNTEELEFVSSELPIEIARTEFRDYFAVLHIGEDIMQNSTSARIYSNEATSIGVEMNISAQIAAVIQNEKLKEHNIENLPQILSDIHTDVNLQSFKNTDDSADEESSSSVVASIMAYVLSFVLYMFLLIYGVMVMQSVIEEKNNRVLEVVVSSVNPFELMIGKILGIASVGVLQIVIWAVLIAGIGYFVLPEILPEEIVAALAQMKQGAAVSEVNGGAEMGIIQAIMMLSNVEYISGIVLALLVFFIGGFLLYAAMFAAVGSAVDSPQDAQQLQTPIMMPIIIGLFVMLSVINDPTSDLAFWFSMIPFTSPIVMMARIPYEIPIWEVLVSATILYATFIVVVWGAAKIYRVGILTHGNKPSLKELWKWMRYK